MKKLFATILAMILIIPAVYAASSAMEPVLLNNFGYYAYQNGDLEVAERLFDEALTLDPEYVKARENRATVRHELEKYDEAAQDLQVLVVVDEDNVQYWYDLGVNHIADFRFVSKDIQDFYDGYDAYMQASDIDAGYAHLQENLAVLDKIRAEFGI